MMKLKFLCAHHRSWLMTHPGAALSTCLDAYERGVDLAQENDFAVAASHAGCSLEAAQILIESSHTQEEAMIERYRESGSLLVFCLEQLGELKLAANVRSGLVAKLRQLNSSFTTLTVVKEAEIFGGVAAAAREAEFGNTAVPAGAALH